MRRESEYTADGAGRLLIRFDKARIIEEGADKVILAVPHEAVLHYLRESLLLWEELFNAAKRGGGE